VSQYARDVAVELGLPEHMQSLALLAGAVHDIGKRGVPEYILTKPSALTKAERRIVENHVLDGETMLIYLAEIVKHHHERYDGKGYPDGLAEDKIPIISSILSVCDAYNAMVSDRAYRKAMDAEDAIAEIRRCAGSQFDPEVVEVFTRMVENAPEEYRLGRGPQFDNVLDKYPTG
jgi:HD-GYP domain-containing protein (c-di-GMP phosphodiesterase class II)